MGELDLPAKGIELIEKVPLGYTRRAVILANLFRALERYDDAIPLYEEAIAEEPDFWLPYVNLLECLRVANSSALELWLERAKQALPNSTPVALEYCYHCFRSLKLEELADADWIEDLKPDSERNDILGRSLSDPHTILLARMWRLCGIVERDRIPDRLPEVVDLLESADAPAGICDIACVVVGAASNLGRPDIVDNAFSFICESCTGDQARIPDLPTCLARALQTSGDLEGAAEACKGILGDNPNNRVALSTYWWVLDDLGRGDEALDAASRLLAIAPNEPNIHYNLGFLYGKAGKLKASREHYELQLGNTKDHWRCLENLALILLLDQEIEEAKKLAERALKLESSALIEDVIREAPGFEMSEIENAVAQTITGKTRKFEELSEFARGALGSHTYSSGILAMNREGEFYFGASTRINSDVFTVGDILSALQDPTSVHAREASRYLSLQQRGDHSNIFERLRQELPELSVLPDNAVSALLEAERRLASDVEHDFAPDVVSFAKSYEIALRELVFESYKTYCQIAINVEAEVQIAMQAKFRQAHNFVRYITRGHHMELGTMVKTLELCTGKTARRLSLVGELREYIDQKLGVPELLEKEYLRRCSELAAYRNQAAHAEPYTREVATTVRRLSVDLLRAFCTIQPSAEGRTN